VPSGWGSPLDLPGGSTSGARRREDPKPHVSGAKRSRWPRPLPIGLSLTPATSTRQPMRGFETPSDKPEFHTEGTFTDTGRFACAQTRREVQRRCDRQWKFPQAELRGPAVAATPRQGPGARSRCVSRASRCLGELLGAHHPACVDDRLKRPLQHLDGDLTRATATPCISAFRVGSGLLLVGRDRHSLTRGPDSFAPAGRSERSFSPAGRAPSH
jgi:hypothetical protein